MSERTAVERRRDGDKDVLLSNRNESRTSKREELSQAHMLGMNHVVEFICQLRGHGGDVQGDGAEVGLATGYGDRDDGAITIMARG